MNEIYSVEQEKKLNKKLRLYLAGSAAVVLIAAVLETVAVLTWSVTVAETVILGFLTALVATGIYTLVQRGILPLCRTDRLMKQLQHQQPEDFKGVFKGFAEGKIIHSGVMMYRLRLDEGKRVGKEPVFRELSIPAIFGKPQIEEGTILHGTCVESIVVTSELPSARELKPREGRYQVPPAVVTAIAAAAALLWCGIYSGIHKQNPETVLNVAVCTPAHHEETELELKQALRLDGIEAAFSYTNTLDTENVAMYLATFGSMDADILILNGDQFAGVFENEAQPLDERELRAALGFEPRFATDAAGQNTGVVLYIPDDPEYNAHFPKLIDWFAVEKDVALIAAVRYGSVHADSGRANLALVQLLTYLADK